MYTETGPGELAEERWKPEDQRKMQKWSTAAAAGNKLPTGVKAASAKQNLDPSDVNLAGQTKTVFVHINVACCFLHIQHWSLLNL